jgi:c-di-GMP-related signal transduction protein
MFSTTECAATRQITGPALARRFLWISLVSIASLGDEAADGLLKLPLLRAMFCELIGKKMGTRREVDELFLLGLLSVMDALLNMRMSDVLAEIPVGAEIKKALLGFPGPAAPFLKCCWTTSQGPGSNWRIRRERSG